MATSDEMNFMSTGWQGLPTNLQSVGVGVGANFMSRAVGEESGDIMRRAATSQSDATGHGDHLSLLAGFRIYQGLRLGFVGTYKKILNEGERQVFRRINYNGGILIFV